jgi:outer membrane lipoprotein-sorting protein
VNKRGEQRGNKVKIYRKVMEKVEKQLIEYLEPADVEGTKFLSISEEGKEDLMYLYLPFLGRERRIAAQEKGKTFMGTDFTYEEIGSSESYREKYKAERLENENFENYPCYVLRLSPKEKEIKYNYLKMWVWKEEFLPLKIEFYAQDAQLEKVLTDSDLRKEKEGYIPYKIVMADQIKGTKTIIEILETKEEEVSEDYFTLRYLRR